MMIFAVNDDEGTESYATDIAEVFYNENVVFKSGCWT